MTRQIFWVGHNNPRFPHASNGYVAYDDGEEEHPIVAPVVSYGEAMSRMGKEIHELRKQNEYLTQKVFEHLNVSVAKKAESKGAIEI